jgi:hypothetical protein
MEPTECSTPSDLTVRATKRIDRRKTADYDSDETPLYGKRARMTSSYATSEVAASCTVMSSSDVTEHNTSILRVRKDLAMTEKQLQFDDNGSTVDVRGKTPLHCVIEHLATAYKENQSSSNVPVGSVVNAKPESKEPPLPIRL